MNCFLSSILISDLSEAWLQDKTIFSIVSEPPSCTDTDNSLKSMSGRGQRHSRQGESGLPGILFGLFSSAQQSTLLGRAEATPWTIPSVLSHGKQISRVLSSNSPSTRKNRSVNVNTLYAARAFPARIVATASREDQFVQQLQEPQVKRVRRARPVPIEPNRGRTEDRPYAPRVCIAYILSKVVTTFPP